ncbi:hypothetical protein DM02DRAFT_236383 [Periconia macrospinosa]|uniref:Uncharacterized protein n=1 Tax=Periconia macrospinosa TaxID=97972 RepID=A0A2V1ED20_9PLEO|nr:hypothetical protein DM02DRAFT_236383 [Periconia macrospinosa]
MELYNYILAVHSALMWCMFLLPLVLLINWLSFRMQVLCDRLRELVQPRLTFHIYNVFTHLSLSLSVCVCVCINSMAEGCDKRMCSTHALNPSPR